MCRAPVSVVTFLVAILIILIALPRMASAPLLRVIGAEDRDALLAMGMTLSGRYSRRPQPCRKPGRTKTWRPTLRPPYALPAVNRLAPGPPDQRFSISYIELAIFNPSAPAASASLACAAASLATGTRGGEQDT
jgi:hypothetical protein